MSGNISGKNGPLLNAYPDSIGGHLKDTIEFLQHEKLEDVFDTFYILPSVFNSDLDRGFSIIDYSLNEAYAAPEDLLELQKLNIALKFDFVLNHASVWSKQFQDIVKNGEKSEYKDFFIQWNKFWDGCGTMTQAGFIQPDEKYVQEMFFRKPGLPILMVRMPDGKDVPYWNTFYQEVNYKHLDVSAMMKAMDIQYDTASRLVCVVNASLEQGKKPSDIDFKEFEKYRDKTIDLLESQKEYLGQMDLNIKSPMVWEFYDDTLKKLSGYGAKIVRLDAFAYAPKEPGQPNFLNDPGTWELLKRVKNMAYTYQLQLLPEIHSKYEDKIHEKLAHEGYLTYDFFLPGLIIDAMERNTNEILIKWIHDMLEKNIRTVNMLGCHDGIPLLDLKGLLTEDQIQSLIDTVVKRGGFVKDLHGKKNMYYQVNATYYSALGEDDKKLLLARAIQIFMPGKPQVWYLDLLAGKNDHEAVNRAGAGGHKEINRTNVKLNEAFSGLEKEVVVKQLDLLRFRNRFPAFGHDAQLEIQGGESDHLKLSWTKNDFTAVLEANLKDYGFKIVATDDKGNQVFTW